MELDLIKDALVKLENVLEEARTDYTADNEAFYASKIFKMGRFIRLYSEFMKKLEVLIDIDVNSALEMYDDNENKLVSRLDKFKSNWNEFLENVEKKVKNV